VERHHRIRRSTLATALGAAVTVSVFAPSLAGGDVVGDVVNGVGSAVGGAGQSADDRAGTPPNYVPPMHGTNPHGQGTVATVDLNPSNTNPYPADPAASGEEVVIGDSRGEQNGSAYHGKVMLAHVNLPIIGSHDIVAVESNPGQSNTGPTGPANTALANLCAASANAICVAVLPMSSSTTSTGSSNSFAVTSGSVSIPASGVGATFGAASSSGNIQESGGCQTASGSSSVATVGTTVPGLGALPPPSATVMQSSSSSTACNNGTQSTSNSSTLGTLAGFSLAPPPPFPAGCGTGAPDSNFTTLSPVAATVCHPDDANTGQTSSPYGVREAFTVFAAIGLALETKLAISGPESHAVAPPATPATTPTGPGNPGGNRNPGNAGGAAGEAAGEAQPGGAELPFTGQNLLLLGLIGAGLISLGLLGMSASDRRTV
jgi:hypothetical protein